MKNIRKFTEEELYYFLKENENKTLVVECDNYGCYSNTEILKSAIDNLVIDMETDVNTGKIFIKIEDEESELGWNWLTIYVADIE